MFGAVLIARDGSAGMAHVRSFLKSSSGSNLAPPWLSQSVPVRVNTEEGKPVCQSSLFSEVSFISKG